MQLYTISIIATAAALCIFLLIISKDQIALKLKAMIKRKKGYMLIHKLGSDKKLHSHVAAYRDGMVMLPEQRYRVEKEHIHFDPHYQLPSAVVSENTANSIDPTSSDQNVLTPTTVDQVVHAAVMGPESMILKRLITINTIMVALNTLAMVGMVVVMYMLINGAQEAGIKIAMG